MNWEISCCWCLVTDGYICSRTKKPVEASSILSLEELPPILILHLKRFVYSGASGGCQKVKAIFLKEYKFTKYPFSLVKHLPCFIQSEFVKGFSELRIGRAPFAFCILGPWNSIIHVLIHNTVNFDLIFNWHKERLRIYDNVKNSDNILDQWEIFIWRFEVRT